MIQLLSARDILLFQNLQQYSSLSWMGIIPCKHFHLVIDPTIPVHTWQPPRTTITYITVSQTMTDSKIAIFPATGGLGGSTLTHLSSLIPASRIVAIVRHPSKISQQLVSQGLTVRQADYDDEDSLTTAFKDVTTLNLISYITYVHEHRTKVCVLSSVLR